MDNCIFCKIIAGEIPSNKVYEDEDMLAFRDINPQAKVHCLCVPKSHFATLAEMDEKQAADKIRKMDRDRKNYYEARTKREWGGIDANSMMFNASLLGIDGVVDALEAIYRKWENRE